MVNEQRRINDKQGSMIIEEWTIKKQQGSMNHEQ